MKTKNCPSLTLFILLASVLLDQVSCIPEEKDISGNANREPRQYHFPAPLNGQFYNNPWSSYAYYPYYSAAVQPYYGTTQRFLLNTLRKLKKIMNC